MHVYVDADASPVKDIIIEETEDTPIGVTLVSSLSHYSTKPLPDHVKTIYVDEGAEAADYRLMQLIKKDDVLVTQDYGLASLALSKETIVLHHKGYQYTKENIDQLLQQRYFSAMARKSGKHTKGPKALTESDREKFRTLFKEIISK